MSDTPWSGWCVPGNATTRLLPAAGGGKTQWFHPDFRGGKCEKCVSRVLDVQFFIVVVDVIAMLQVISRP